MRRILPTTLLSLALLPAGVAVASDPSLTVTPKRLPFGETFTVKGRGWDSRKAVDRVIYLGLHGPNGERVHIGNATNGKHGRWTFAYEVKRVIGGPGTWKLIVRQDRKQGGKVVKYRRTATVRITRR